MEISSRPGLGVSVSLTVDGVIMSFTFNTLNSQVLCVNSVEMCGNSVNSARTVAPYDGALTTHC